MKENRVTALKRLKTLDEHNKEVDIINKEIIENKKKLNGIACPKCGKELYDRNPKATTEGWGYNGTTSRATSICCGNCTYSSHRLVENK